MSDHKRKRNVSLEINNPDCVSVVCKHCSKTIYWDITKRKSNKKPNDKYDIYCRWCGKLNIFSLDETWFEKEITLDDFQRNTKASFTWFHSEPIACLFKDKEGELYYGDEILSLLYFEKSFYFKLKLLFDLPSDNNSIHILKITNDEILIVLKDYLHLKKKIGFVKSDAIIRISQKWSNVINFEEQTYYCEKEKRTKKYNNFYNFSLRKNFENNCNWELDISTCPFHDKGWKDYWSKHVMFGICPLDEFKDNSDEIFEDSLFNQFWDKYKPLKDAKDNDTKLSNDEKIEIYSTLQEITKKMSNEELIQHPYFKKVHLGKIIDTKKGYKFFKLWDHNEK